MIIAKLYKKLTTDQNEPIISDEEMNFLVRYELPHILQLDDMRTRGFPCNSKAIDKTKKGLDSIRRNILKKLSKRDLVLKFSTVFWLEKLAIPLKGDRAGTGLP